MTPELGFVVFLSSIALGVALTAPAYRRLFALLEAEAPATWEALGRPSLLNASPSKSLALQRFLYDRRRQPDSEPIRRLCAQLSVTTPLLIAAVAAQILYWSWRALSVLP